MDRMPGRINRDVRGNLSVFSDPHFADIENCQIIVREKVLSDLNIIPVVAVERCLDMHVLPRFSKDLLNELILLLFSLRRKIIIFIYALFILQPLLCKSVQPGLIRQACKHSFLLIHVFLPGTVLFT